MRVSAFKVNKPVPELNDPIVFGTLIPWLDAGNVGTVALSRLEESLQAVRIAELAVPGRFFDFTRYRPLARFVEGKRVLQIPNSTLSYAKRPGGSDILFLNMMEPHLFAERYIDAVLLLLQALGIKKHCRLGAWWDAVPHTRALPVSYSVAGQQIDIDTREVLPRRPGGYEGPTSIMNQVTDRLESLGIENQSLMLRLPYYARLEEDHTGVARLLETMLQVFDLPTTLADVVAAEAYEGKSQYQRLSSQVSSNPEVSSLLQRLEEDYDSQERVVGNEPPPPLSPEVETFLREINDQLGGQGN